MPHLPPPTLPDSTLHRPLPAVADLRAIPGPLSVDVGAVPQIEQFEEESDGTRIARSAKRNFGWTDIFGPIAVWLVWWVMLWQFGPSSPPSVHNLADLNKVISDSVPLVNKMLHRHVPVSVGNCPEFAAKLRELSKDPSLAPGHRHDDVLIPECVGEDPLAKGTLIVPYGLTFLPFNVVVKWATGLST